MRSLTLGTLVAVAATLAVAGQSPAPPQGLAATDQDRTAVRQAAYDYAEGYYEGAAERMERSVHPGLIKRGVVSRPGVGSLLAPMNAETLVDLTRQGGGKDTPTDKRGLAFALLDIRDNVASAKIFTATFNDYLHLVKQDGRWRIVHVLWQPPVPGAAANADVDRAAVMQALRDYIDAIDGGDTARIERVIHPEAALRTLRATSPAGAFYLVEGNRDGVVAAVRARVAQPPQNPVVRVLDVYDTVASALVTASQSVSYWHLARQNGQWRAVNRLSR
jgi:hypothetical protein